MHTFSFNNPSIDAFIEDLTRRAGDHGVGIELSDGLSIPYPGTDGSHVSGYFMTDPTPVLAVATGAPASQWLEILVHEASHMDQWIENASCWTNNTMPDGREAVDWLDAWCAGTLELTDQELAQVVSLAKEVEMDCERRTLAKIAQWGLPIDPKAYAQRANAYVHFYDDVARTGRWNDPGKAPYQLEDVWGSAPTSLVDEAPEALRAAYERNYHPQVRKAPRP